MRAYPLYPQRRTDSLDGIWQFAWLGEDCCALEKLKIKNLKFTESAAVPGAFDAGPKYAGLRGIGVYRRTVITNDDAPRALLIDGLGPRARIWWDDTEIAFDELPYTTIRYPLPPGKAGVHTLTIAVDNRFINKDSELCYPFYDFYIFGGIYRSVAIQTIPDFRLDRVQVRTLSTKTKTVELTVLFEGKVPKKCDLSIAFDSGTATKFREKTENGAVKLVLPVPNGKLWSPENPNLHTVTVTIPGDTIVERFGIRTIKAEKQKILLNGKPIRLQGVCRHESHPELGPAIPEQIMMEDVEYLKEVGGNFFRCVHYPQSQSFFDLCDQMGILVWEESLGWGDSEKSMTNPEFIRKQHEQTRLMVRNGINHPSIIIWAFNNEGFANKPETIPYYKGMVDLLHAEDSSRLASFASCRLEADLCIQFADVVSFNIYPGWMSNDWEHTKQLFEIEPRVKELGEFANRPDLKDKPLILSEIGCCGIYGYRDRVKARWSEEYQADHMTESCRAVFANPRYSGLSLWQFYDSRTFANGVIRTKGRGFNNAGIMDEYRRPKLAFDALKKFFHEN